MLDDQNYENVPDYERVMDKEDMENNKYMNNI